MSLRNGSYSTPRWRGAAPTTPSCSVRSATRSTTVCVSKTLSATCSCGCASANWQRSCASTTPPGPVDAPISNAPSSSPVAPCCSSLTISSSSCEQPLRAAVEPKPGLGRLDPPPGAVEELRPEPLLERAHLQADRRLRHPEPLSRLRERRRSTTSQNACNCRVSITVTYSGRQCLNPTNLVRTWFEPRSRVPRREPGEPRSNHVRGCKARFWDARSTPEPRSNEVRTRFEGSPRGRDRAACPTSR